MPSGSRGVLRSAARVMADLDLDGALARPLHVIATNIRTVKTVGIYADRGASAALHTAHTLSLHKRKEVTLRDLHRYRFYDKAGDVGIIGFLSQQEDFAIDKAFAK